VITTISEDPYANVTPMLPEPKRLVLEALRSDRFKQGRGYLAAPADWDTPGAPIHHCCLGVMCEVAIEAGVDVERTERTGSRVIAYDQNTSLPPRSVMGWLFGPDVAHRDITIRVPVADDRGSGEETVELTDLIDLNDDAEWTFEQIAQVIEDTL
jgi:hypothetical protein